MEDKDWDNIGKHLAGESSKEEQDQFNLWIQDPINHKLYSQAKEIWGAVLIRDNIEVDVERGWTKFTAKTGIKGTEISMERKRNFSFLYKIAASLLVILFASYLFTSKFSSRKIIDLQTSVIEKKEFTLPDGSRVWLNNNSKISYSEDFDIENRVVTLTGEAFFEVEKAGGKTFTILSEDAKTEVIGTQFNVRAYETEKEVEVTVLEGRVSFSKKDDSQKLFLKRGEKGTLDKLSKVHMSSSENQNEAAWKTHKLAFDNTEISRVLKTLEKYFGTTINVNNPNILKCKFTGQFENPELKQILEVLSLSVDLKYENRSKGYFLIGLGCNNN